MTEQDLIDMKLHEKKAMQSNTEVVKQWILRVVGGWIYYRQVYIQHRTRDDLFVETATFVPEIAKKKATKKGQKDGN